MLDRLIEIVVQFGEQLKPYEVVMPYDGAIRLRLGENKGILQPGKLHWKIPFADEIISHTTVWTTLNLPVQSLTTLDKKQVVVKGVIKYRVTDIEHFLLEVYDALDALSDMVCGIIADLVENMNWVDILDREFQKNVTKKAKKEAESWGIEIKTVTLTDKAEVPSVRLFNEGQTFLT